ncbi:MAG: long-chain fatty acid--CoA ligase, partial [Candidatus Eremiobacteraeota bacterium]|nr:long-chain fatty acid--CoA ligase [Candidatus Eremiobacteraeota bacterium]
RTPHSGLELSGAREMVVVDATRADNIFARPIDPQSETLAFESISSSDPFAIVYTSGTTGSPKGALLTHGNLIWNARATAHALALTPSDVTLVCVPVTHIFGISAAVLTTACVGGRCVLMKDYAAGPALDLCEQESVSVHHGTPTMFVLELAAQRRAARDLRSLRTGIIAAAPVQADLVTAIRAELVPDIEIAWGLTETAPTITITTPLDEPTERTESVGKVLPGAQIRLDLQEFEYGEILVKSPGVIAKYFNDPQLDARAFTSDGWFRTGDLGYLDARGYLHLRGRHKEIIIRGGMHVYPEEVEAIVRTLPWVESLCIVGIPDRVLGERTCACIVVAESAAAPENLLDAVRAAVAGRLADYKIPDSVLRVAELPRSPGGKVLKAVLQSDAIKAMRAG